MNHNRINFIPVIMIFGCLYPHFSLTQKTTIYLRYDNMGKSHIDLTVEDNSVQNKNKYLFVNYKGIGCCGTNSKDDVDDNKKLETLQKLQSFFFLMNSTRIKFQESKSNFFEFLQNGYRTEEMVWEFEKKQHSTIEKLKHRVYVDQENYYERDFLDERDVKFKKDAQGLYEAYHNKKKKN